VDNDEKDKLAAAFEKIINRNVALGEKIEVGGYVFNDHRICEKCKGIWTKTDEQMECPYCKALKDR